MTDHRTDRNPAAPDSGGARELVAEALLPHGWEYPDSFDDCGAYIDSQGAYAMHLADALLASPQFARLIAEAKAEAWDEGYDEGMADNLVSNPYREAAQ